MVLMEKYRLIKRLYVGEKIMKTEISFKKILKKTESIRSEAWESFRLGKSIGRIAVKVRPNQKRIERAKEKYQFDLNKNVAKPDIWTENWDKVLKEQIYEMLATLEVSGDFFPALLIPRFIHGASQGICDIFGSKIEELEDGNFHAHPLPSTPEIIDNIEVLPIENSMYWGAVEWIKYSREMTNDEIPFKNPVMTGPIDTANYILGTTTLMEWIYLEPEVLHRLLERISMVIIKMINKLKNAAGGVLHSECIECMPGAFALCSEVRSIISKQAYEEFEAPYLRKIGEETGVFAIHSCGSWERTVKSALQDPNLLAMNGQVRENDLSELFKQGEGKVVFSINRSENLDERFTWQDEESYIRHVIECYSPNDILEIGVSESEGLFSFKKYCRELHGHDGNLPNPVI